MTSPRFNIEFDSRVLRTSISQFGRVAPSLSLDGRMQKVSCLNCGKAGGNVTSEIPIALRNDPGVIYICNDCESRVGSLPVTAISFGHRKGLA